MKRPVSSLALRAGATLAAFALAMYGFAEAHLMLHHSPARFSTLGFQSLQLIIGRFPAELDDQALPWSLQIARFALPLTTFWTTVALAWRQVRNVVQGRWIARRGEHLVLAGGADLARDIAIAERGAGRPVLLWLDDPKAGWVEDVADLGAPHVAIDREEKGIDRLGLDRARAALLVSPDDPGNMALAFATIEEVARHRARGDPLPVIVRIDDTDLRTTIEQRFAQIGDHPAARLRIVSVPDIIARQLFLDQPLDRFHHVGTADRVIFAIGFGAVVERTILRVLAGSHFRDGHRPRFVVFDAAAGAQEAVFRARWPGADALAPVRFVQAAIEQPALLSGLMAGAIDAHGQPIAIIVDSEDRARALALGYAADAHFIAADRPSPPIHVRVGACSEEQLGTAIHGFGGPEILGDSERLLQDRHDALARAIHDFYFEGRLTDGDRIGSRASMQEWEDLSEDVRDDNRLVADCYQLKLRDIGARLVAGDAGFRFELDELEELARAEHDRWMAAKLIDGWRFAAVRNDTLRHHPDLVDYDALSEPIKELDREQIRLMTRLLPRSGLSPRRILAVHISPAARGDCSLEEALARILARHPDRIPVVSGRFEDPSVRGVLRAAQEAGVPVQVAIATNAEAIMRTLNGTERAATRRLIRAADTLHAFPSTTAPAEIERWLGKHAHLRLGAGADGRVTADGLA